MLSFLEEIRLVKYIKSKLYPDPLDLEYNRIVDVKDNPHWINIRRNNLRTTAQQLADGIITADTSPIYSNTIGLLHMSLIHDRIELFKLALLYKGNVNLQSKEGTTPLHLAAAFGRLNMAQELLDNDADPSIKNRDGHTPLDIAKLYRQEQMQELLMKYNNQQ